MSRTIRHLQHGNVTVSINGPTEIVDDFRVVLNYYLAGIGTVGRQLGELSRTAEAIGGEFTDFRQSEETVWKSSVDSWPLEITVFG